MTNPVTPETIAATLTAAGFAEYRDGQFGFTVTRAAFGGEIIIDLKGIDLLPFNPGEGPRALLNDYRTALDAAGYLVRSTLGLVCVDPDGGVRAPQDRRDRGVLMFNPDRMVRIGEIPDLDFSTDVPRRTPVAVRRDNDLLILPAAQIDLAGVRELENVVDRHRNAVARYRLRELDLDDYGIDGAGCFEELTDIPGFENTDGLEDADWVEVGRRLHVMRAAGGYTELRGLSSLLSCDDPAKWCNCVISGGLFLPVACHLHGVPCDECGGLAGCKPGCGNERLPLVES